MKFSLDNVVLRRTSDSDAFPWLGQRVTLMRVTPAGSVSQAKTDGEKRALLWAASDKDLVLAAWPGEWSQDVFVVDDLRAARLALGLPRHGTTTDTARAAPAVQTDNRSDPDHAPQLGLWARLAQMPALSVEGQRQISRLSFGTHHQAMKVLLRRPDLDPEARQLVFDNVSEWTADDLVKEELCTMAEAGGLLERFPSSTPLLVAALRRPDTRVVAQQRVDELSYDQAARLWDRWTSGPDLAEVLLPVILTKEPANRPVSGYQTEQDDRSSLVASMLERLPAERRLEWLRNPEHGALVRQALLTGTNLSDSELLECLPEITKPAAIQAGGTPALVEYMHRHPQLIDLAKAELGAAVARLLADGWQLTQIARASKWDVLVTVARLAETPGLIEDLARASVFDRRDPIRTAVETERWHEPRRYTLVDHLVNNTAASDKQITYILDRLVTSHVIELREVAPKRSRLKPANYRSPPQPPT